MNRIYLAVGLLVVGVNLFAASIWFGNHHTSNPNDWQLSDCIVMGNLVVATFLSLVSALVISMKEAGL